ncbi:MAG TPA: fumarate reductase subunit FrdD [Vicinamibacterales bacterium]|jgi:fumarate reductase subunit D
MTTRSVEPRLWILFSAGGVLSALAVPILALLFGLAYPLGWLPPPDYSHLLDLVSHPIARAGGFVLCALSLFHWAHRFRYTLYDGLQIKHLDELINLLCYGGAVAGTVWAALLFWRLP